MEIIKPEREIMPVPSEMKTGSSIQADLIDINEYSMTDLNKYAPGRDSSKMCTVASNLTFCNYSIIY